MKLEEVRGRVECVSLCIEPMGGPEPITSTFLRSLPVASVVDKALGDHLDFLTDVAERGGAIGMSEDTRERAAKARRRWERWTASRRGGPTPKYGPEHFEAIAATYTDALAARKPPTREVARHFQVSESTAAKWVARARALGLLPKTTKGKAKGVFSRRG